MTTSNVSAGRWVRRGGEIILFPAQFQAEGPEQEFGAGATPFVRWVQTMLNLVGGMSLPVSGILDTPTRTGIRQFQQRKGLVADGVVGPRTEAAFVSGGGVPFRLFGTGLPAQVGQPGPWVPRCGGNEVSCMTMTAAEQARVFSKGGTPQGQAQDRTPESAREVKLQVHLSDYDVNDWLVRKPAHKAALDRVIEFIKADPSGKPVEVTIS
ncbi:peptidoglycan-binding domain-containing protein, partial [Longimicrobium sp.]|uniref:peptidoglycan-binding domain-containing protein n=1 Tax=Longimicrobium sp. TaxID=2029185 RepID=UPI002F94FF72